MNTTFMLDIAQKSKLVLPILLEPATSITEFSFFSKFYVLGSTSFDFWGHCPREIKVRCPSESKGVPNGGKFVKDAPTISVLFAVVLIDILTIFTKIAQKA